MPSKPVLRISPDLALPALEAQTQTMVVYGAKGAGKTNFAAVGAEELARCGLRFSWIDPVGVAWGLKHSGDGRGDGVPVLVLGGAHGDLPIEPTAGAVIADLVADEDVSVIIDISRHANGKMWSQGEKIRFVRDYAQRLFARQGERRRPLMQIIDEAGRFVPQQPPRGAVDIMECVGAIEQLVELGRNVGVGVALITQRSARMNKSVSELAEMMVAFRTVGPRSIDAILDWFGEHIPRKRAMELVGRLRQLDRGTALIVSPGWLGVEGEYHIRARETFDSSDTPVAGRERKPTGKGAAIDRDRYLQRMSETIERATQDDPKALRKRIAELERQVATKDQPAPPPEMVEVQVVPDGLAASLADIQADLAKGIELLEHASTCAAYEHVRVQQIRVAREGAPRQRGRPGVALIPKLDPAATPRPVVLAGEAGSSNGLSKVERSVLSVLFQHGPLGKRPLAMLAGYSAKGGGFNNGLSALRTKGLLEGRGDPLTATAEGIAVIQDHVEPLPTGRALFDYWLGQVGKAERSILEALAIHRSLDKTELGAATGYSSSGGGFNNALSRLRTLQLIQGSGWLELDPTLSDCLAREGSG